MAFNQRSTWWSITAYGDNIAKVEDVNTYPKCVKAVHGGRESCPETGREHYQGAVECHGQQRGAFFRDWLPGVHFEVAKSAAALKKYALKSDTAIGPKGTTVNPDAYMKLDDQLMMLANVYHDAPGQYDKLASDWDEKGKFTDKDWKKHYWALACSWLNKDPSKASCVANPALEKMWIHTHSVWIARALVLQARADKDLNEDLSENLLSPVEVQPNATCPTQTSPSDEETSVWKASLG